MQVSIVLDGRRHEVTVESTDEGWTVTVDGTEVTMARDGDRMVGPKGVIEVLLEQDGVAHVDGRPRHYEIKQVQGLAGIGASGGASGQVMPPMTGKIIRVDVAPGDEVDAGDVLFVLEAMKMQNEVRSPIAGTVTDVHVEAGQSVAPDMVVVSVEPA